ncbi:MAG: hypothetical protein H7Y36_12215 [Armatimonadetes bacterium]|nr:hypothetical protein [Akkermansiaceae bacterium]
MKTFSILAALCFFSCSRVEHPAPTDTPTEQGRTTLTLGNLVHVDATSEGISHPLVCGVGRDFPDGHELIFRSLESGELVHSVLPEHEPPKTLDGKFFLNGHYQTIQNRKSYSIKQPPEDYRYFVASSWEQQK